MKKNINSKEAGCIINHISNIKIENNGKSMNSRNYSTKRFIIARCYPIVMFNQNKKKRSGRSISHVYLKWYMH